MKKRLSRQLNESLNNIIEKQIFNDDIQRYYHINLSKYKNELRWFLVDRDGKRMLLKWPKSLRKDKWILLKKETYRKLLKTKLHMDVFPVDGNLYPSILIR